MCMYAVTGSGEIVKKMLRRKQVLAYFANMGASVVGLESCGSGHYCSRELTKLGHVVKLINPRLVKPYVKGNKNDFNDAEAIFESVTRPNMRFVTDVGDGKSYRHGRDYRCVMPPVTREDVLARRDGKGGSPGWKTV